MNQYLLTWTKAESSCVIWRWPHLPFVFTFRILKIFPTVFGRVSPQTWPWMLFSASLWLHCLLHKLTLCYIFSSHILASTWKTWGLSYVSLFKSTTVFYSGKYLKTIVRWDSIMFSYGFMFTTNIFSYFSSLNWKQYMYHKLLKIKYSIYKWANNDILYNI